MRTIKTCSTYVAMVVVQLAYAGSNILIKISLEKGMNQFVLVVYRHLIGMLVLGPFSYFLERGQRPSLSFPIMMKIFVLSSLGTTIHMNIYYLGLGYTTATAASALSNVIPALTFALAVLLRMEKVSVRSVKGQAKVLGSIICIGGALVFIFWKGGYLFKSFTQRPLMDVNEISGSTSRHGKVNWIMGSALILISHTAWSSWLILQAIVYKVYPAALSLNTLICFFASLQSAFIALIFERNLKSWRLEWGVQLITIVYCGAVLSALMGYLQTWCISQKGPVFAAMFSPLLLVIVGIFSAIAFAERLHLGSLVGALLIIVGLYCVLWAKSREKDVGKSRSGRYSDDHQARDGSPLPT